MGTRFSSFESGIFQEVQDLISQVDKDGDGRVNKDEFKRLMASQ